MSEILRLASVSKSYGALKVTDALSLTLAKDEALGIIGPNGAGKSSLFNLIAGGIGVDGGHIYFHGQDITGISAARRCRLGIGRSYQIPHPFAGMTVFENLLVGGVFGQNVAEKQTYACCIDVLEKTGLIDKANLPAGKLTLLERKRLELARALATNPDLLLLDEIAGGLTEHECHELVATILDIKARGVSIIWIEHIVHALLAVVDRLIVINFGVKVAEGDPREVMGSAEVREIYMGIEADA
ncbi:ABC transporter ATP-binding protein [Sinorhizobium meliloti]|uniref:ABC transporter ATP-binding protein n=1 Tax=Rhizobium meliloti TaxID=382 RepID=UPI003F14D48E